MIASAPLAYPASRTLAGWWRQLASWQPRAMWAGHLLLHRIEAMVQRSLQRKLDPLDQLVLKALILQPAIPLERLNDRLQLGIAHLGQLLRRLEKEGLASQQAGQWQLSPVGTTAATNGAYARPEHDRHLFHFVADESPGKRHFVHLDPQGTIPLATDAGWKFEPEFLDHCFAQPAQWKQDHQFPGDIEAVVRPSATGETANRWRHVMLDRPQRLPLIIIRTGVGESERLQGFAVQQEGWVLEPEKPAFALGAGWQTVLPQLADPPADEVWQEAWRSWCQTRGVSAVPEETTRLQFTDHTLHVTVAPPLLERLRSGRGDALKEETWLLAGGARLRPAALLEVVAG